MKIEQLPQADILLHHSSLGRARIMEHWARALHPLTNTAPFKGLSLIPFPVGAGKATSPWAHAENTTRVWQMWSKAAHLDTAMALSELQAVHLLRTHTFNPGQHSALNIPLVWENPHSSQCTIMLWHPLCLSSDIYTGEMLGGNNSNASGDAAPSSSGRRGSPAAALQLPFAREHGALKGPSPTLHCIPRHSPAALHAWSDPVGNFPQDEQKTLKWDCQNLYSFTRAHSIR